VDEDEDEDEDEAHSEEPATQMPVGFTSDPPPC
jgi:hypothetical protein